jgi:hypothetical protein
MGVVSEKVEFLTMRKMKASFNQISKYAVSISVCLKRVAYSKEFKLKGRIFSILSENA